jgi:hypothetical protein
LTDTSTDYGEIDLEHVLAGTLSVPRQHSQVRGAAGGKRVSVAHFEEQDHPHAHFAPNQAFEFPQHDANAPHSQEFLRHRHEHYHGEAQVALEKGKHKHAHYAPQHAADLSKHDVNAPHSEEFLQHRHEHYHGEAQAALKKAKHKHAHYAPQQAPEFPMHDANALHSEEFLRHRHDHYHGEAQAALEKAKHKHAHYAPQQAPEFPMHDANAPHSEEFRRHRHDHYHGEAQAALEKAKHKHAHYAPQQAPEFPVHDANAPHSEEFLRHRHDHYHGEAQAALEKAKHKHAHYAPQQAPEFPKHDANAPHSEEFLRHRHDHYHGEAPAALEKQKQKHAHYAPQQAPDFPKHDANAPHSEEFLRHRHDHYHGEAQAALEKAKHKHAHCAPQQAPEFPKHDANAPHSEEFLRHRHEHYHGEAQAALEKQKQKHAHYAPQQQEALRAHDADAPHSEEFLRHRHEHYHEEAHSSSPKAAPHFSRPRAGFEHVMTEFHDLMEEVHHDTALHESSRGGIEQPRDEVTSASSPGWPRQVVDDFLHSERHPGVHHHRDPVHQSWDPANSTAPAERNSPGRGGEHTALRSSYPAAESHRSAGHSPGRAMTGSLLRHDDSPQRGAGLETSMMADSLMGASDREASFSAEPHADGAYHSQRAEGSPSARSEYRYRYRYPSLDSLLQEQPGADFVGLGGLSAEPLDLGRRPRLADTDPVDLDTVNYITSSYSEFFRNSLLQADPLLRERADEGHGEPVSRGSSSRQGTPDRSGSASRGSPSRGPHLTSSPTGQRGGSGSHSSGASRSSHSPNRSADSSVRSSVRSSTVRGSSLHDEGTLTSAPSMRSSFAPQSQHSAAEDFTDHAIPTATMTIQQALAEVEHLRRTNHSLVEALSDESHRRSQLGEKLAAAQVGCCIFGCMRSRVRNSCPMFSVLGRSAGRTHSARGGSGFTHARSEAVESADAHAV